MAIISDIIGFPKDGPDPSQYFKGRENDRKLVDRMKKKYGLKCDGRVYHDDRINDTVVRIGVRILDTNIVRMNIPNQCNSGVIRCTEQCTQCVQMNWSLFLMNELTNDALAV